MLKKYQPVDQIKKISLEKHVVYMGRDAQRNIVGKTEGTKSLVRPSRKWKENIKLDL